MSRQPRRRWREGYTLLVLVFGLLGFRTAVADWNFVPSSSMEPTLEVGDVVLTDKRAFGPTLPIFNKVLWRTGTPERGDVVTFYPPNTSKLYVKRIVGLPGDEVASDGVRVVINGEPARFAVEDSMGLSAGGTEVIGDATHRWRISRGGSAPSGRWTVPDGHYFMMGDHRDNSLDSRRFGSVPAERVISRVSRVALSFSTSWPFVRRVGQSLNVD